MKLKIMALITALTANFTCASAKVIDATLNPDSITVGKESILEVNVTAEKLTGIQFDIIYDSTVLEYVQSSVSDTLEDAVAAGVNCAEPGKISALAVFAEEKQMAGQMCEIQFKAVGTNGDKSVKIENIKLMLDGKKESEDGCTISFKTKGRTQSGGGLASSSVGALSNVNKSDKPVSNTDVNSVNEDNADDSKQDMPLKEESEKSFTDISGHWAESSIQFMLREGIISGMDDGTFAPDKNVTRAEFAAILAKALNLDEKSENLYSDVEDGSWYAPAVLECTGAKLIVGDDGKFRPNEYLTREEMAVIVSRAEKYMGLQSDRKSTGYFSDENYISGWAKDAVLEIAGSGIINGYEDGTFRPKENTTRAHAAVVICRLLDKIWDGQ